MFALNSALSIWVLVGGILVISEFILPGLVAVFIGMGALTVGVFLHFEIIETVPSQLLTWFISSTIYIFSIRILVVKLYPSDSERVEIDEDAEMVGQVVKVTEKIPVDGIGRVFYGDSTWKAWAVDKTEIDEGEEVVVVGRDNITWIVEKIDKSK